MLLDSGASVIGVSRRKSSPQNLAVYRDTRRLQLLQCDLSDFVSLDRLFSETLKQIPRLDGVILCHGFGDFGSLEEFSVSRIEQQIDTNLTSNILISRLVIPKMKAQKCGDLILIGSESSLKGGKKGAVYCAAKFGLRGFVQALRQECASNNVRVAIVNPGMVDTEFFDKLDFAPQESRANMLQAKDVASAVKTILDMPAGSVVDEINLSPQKTVIRNKDRKS
jgi:short-subunit dehydrogenase